MKYVKQYMQKTVKSDDPVIFDQMVNAVYLKAAESGKEPEIHYHNVPGFCATIKFFISEQIPEDSQDEFELANDFHCCSECPHFSLPKDKRIKNVHCAMGHFTDANHRACVIFYDLLKGGAINGIPCGSIEEQSILDKQASIL